MASNSRSYSLEEDKLLKSMEANRPRFKVDELNIDDSSQESVARRCGCKVSKENLFVILTLIGVAVGVLLGTTVRIAEPSETAITFIAFPGELFMRMLKMLIIPVLFTSIVVGLAAIDYKTSGKMWVHCFTYYMVTTLLASVLGITLVTVIQPGNPKFRESGLEMKEQQVVSTMDSFLDLLRNLIPDNIVAACFQVVQTRFTKVEEPDVTMSTNGSEIYRNVTTNMTAVYNKSTIKVQSTNALGIMVFAIFFGVTISTLGKESKAVADFMDSLNKIFMKMIMIILWFSPIGICSLIAGNLLKMRSIVDVINMLGLYMVTVASGLFIHTFISLPLIYFAVTRKNPFKLYYGLLQAVFTALGTSSSIGTLPLTMKCLENNVGIDRRVTQFVLPLGATMNMDGTALMEGVAAIAIAQMYEMSLSAGQIVTISLTATLTSIGAAAIPSSGLVMLLIVLNAIGVPSEAVGLLWSIDWFLDRLRTVTNVLGDSIGAGIVDHLNKDLLHEQNEATPSVNKVVDSVAKDSYQLCDSGVSVLSTKLQENML